MSQQMVNGSHRGTGKDGQGSSVTITNRMSDRYAVVGEPNKGKHRKAKRIAEREHDANLRETLRKAGVIK